MKTRKDVIKKLHELESFKNALGSARTDNERRKLVAIAEQFVGAFADALYPVIEKAQVNQNFAQELNKVVIEKDNVFNVNDHTVSGSSG